MHIAGETPVCPHCGVALQAFELPDNTGWQTPFHLACFNDDCPYYQRGWVWMFDRYGVKSSYRHRVDPESGKSSPLAVWSKTAIKDRILDGDVVATVIPGNDVTAGEAGERGEGRGKRAPARPTAPTQKSTTKTEPPQKGEGE